MPRLFLVPLVIWLGGCSLFLYDSASFGIAGADKSGISASVMPHPDALYANDRVRVTLSNKDHFTIFYSTNAGSDPTNAGSQYMGPLDFDKVAPFTLYARVTNSEGIWGDRLVFPVTAIADGSAAHPWQIANERHLSNVRFNMAAGRHFLQTADIAIVSNKPWTPIGTGGPQFSALYDGGGRRITGLVITNCGTVCGLFGAANMATFRNIRIEGADITASDNNVAILCGAAITTQFSDCIIDGGSVRNMNTGSIHTGSLAGLITTGCLVLRCTASGVNVSGGDFVGGLVGNATGGGGFRECTVDPQGISGKACVGGLVGGASSGAGSINFTNCSISGSGAEPISGNSHVGGLIGYYSSGGGFLSECAINIASAVTGTNNVGGLVGNLFGDNIQNCRAIVSVTGVSNVGGLAGYNGGIIFSSLVGPDAGGQYIAGTNFVGGMVGWNKGQINTSGVLGKVSVNGFMHVGGIAGICVDVGQINASFAQCPVTCAGSFGGGAVGSVNDAAFQINECYATGAVSGPGQVLGGFVGAVTNGSLNYCYATGTVVDAAANGTFAGYAMGTISDCVCYTNITVMGEETSLIGSGVSAGIQGYDSPGIVSASTYSGWLTPPWVIVDGVLPYLSWQGALYHPVAP